MLIVYFRDKYFTYEKIVEMRDVQRAKASNRLVAIDAELDSLHKDDAGEKRLEELRKEVNRLGVLCDTNTYVKLNDKIRVVGDNVQKEKMRNSCAGVIAKINITDEKILNMTMYDPYTRIKFRDLLCGAVASGAYRDFETPGMFGNKYKLTVGEFVFYFEMSKLSPQDLSINKQNLTEVIDCLVLVRVDYGKKTINASNLNESPPYLERRPCHIIVMHTMPNEAHGGCMFLAK